MTKEFNPTDVASLILDYVEQNDMNMADLPAYPEWVETEWLQCFRYARKFRLTFKGGQKFDVLITPTEPSRRGKEPELRDTPPNPRVPRNEQ